MDKSGRSSWGLYQYKAPKPYLKSLFKELRAIAGFDAEIIIFKTITEYLFATSEGSQSLDLKLYGSLRHIGYFNPALLTDVRTLVEGLRRKIMQRGRQVYTFIYNLSI